MCRSSSKQGSTNQYFQYLGSADLTPYFLHTGIWFWDYVHFCSKTFLKSVLVKAFIFTANYIWIQFYQTLGLFIPIIFERHIDIGLSGSKTRFKFCEISIMNLLSCSLKFVLKSKIIKMCVKQWPLTFQIFTEELHIRNIMYVRLIRGRVCYIFFLILKYIWYLCISRKKCNKNDRLVTNGTKILCRCFCVSKSLLIFSLLQNECTYQMYLPVIINALFAVCSFKTSRVVFINETLKGGLSCVSHLCQKGIFIFSKS